MKLNWSYQHSSHTVKWEDRIFFPNILWNATSHSNWPLEKLIIPILYLILSYSIHPIKTVETHLSIFSISVRHILKLKKKKNCECTIPDTHANTLFLNLPRQNRKTTFRISDQLLLIKVFLTFLCTSGRSFSLALTVSFSLCGTHLFTTFDLWLIRWYFSPLTVWRLLPPSLSLVPGESLRRRRQRAAFQTDDVVRQSLNRRRLGHHLWLKTVKSRRLIVLASDSSPASKENSNVSVPRSFLVSIRGQSRWLIHPEFLNEHSGTVKSSL